ncbi:hypothetical protein B0H67DRAFT_566968 [Lasiosphaeris hirsuta]|uniref:Cupin type-2 domain-containing protein n=1 Tax=Lasiosphaeris hirsuta TaxID=260670 RepID=A0AA40EED9_9PEZI|nr:hypothetical protein B0H67DRAFT_566968 [Lasiosphaeris hirsuta]
MAEPPKYPWKDNDLRPIQRVITDYDSEGKSVFSSAIPEDLPGRTAGVPAPFRLGYCTNRTPVSLAGGGDIKTYANYLQNPPGLVIPGGTVARYVDMPPGASSPMHRTVSLDYGVVVEGEMELVLDSGETRLLRRGDLAVQRGTMHVWRNASATEWARMLYFLQESEALEVPGAGGKLGEDNGGILASGRERED